MSIRVFNKRQRQGAFTLPEVLVGVAILAILLVTLFAAFGMGFTVIRSTREDIRATQILTQKIEGIRLCTWSQLTNQCPTSFQDTYSTVGNSNSLIYHGTITQGSNSDLPTNYRGKVKLITVTVTWSTIKSGATQTIVTHSRSMQTQSAFYGLQNYLYGNTNSI
jgi:prepilin-type N-terminal cleavage/methylation domain-containing protein